MMKVKRQLHVCDREREKKKRKKTENMRGQWIAGEFLTGIWNANSTISRDRNMHRRSHSPSRWRSLCLESVASAGRNRSIRRKRG